jgi:hypothetical protein
MNSIVGFDDSQYSNTVRIAKIMGNLTVGKDGSPIKSIKIGSFTMIPNNGSVISTFVQQNKIIPGLHVDDIVFVEVSGASAAYVSFERAFISSSDTLTVVWRNLHHSSSATDNLAYADGNVKTIKYMWLDLT